MPQEHEELDERKTHHRHQRQERWKQKETQCETTDSPFLKGI